MVDISRLQDAVASFKFNSKPSSGDAHAPATVGDIKKVVDNIAEVLNEFIEELENTH